MHSGTIKTIKHEAGYGFIRCDNQPDIFFHCTKLADDLDFAPELIGRRVVFDVEHGARGPFASNIRGMK